MKILVSHFGRQYCLELLKVLYEKQWLSAFHTSLASNKPNWLNWLPNLGPALRKRRFDGIPSEKIMHLPVLFVLERLLRHRFPSLANSLINYFDRKVARSLRKSNFDLVISYENHNLETLRTARKLEKITVLDLAQIHHTDIVEYAQGFMSPKELQKEISHVNPRKAKALQYTDYVLTLSGFAAESMLRNGWPAERLFTANLGIDPKRFFFKKKEPQAGKLKLLFVGTMTRRKGLEILFQAINRLPKEQVELTLIGPMADAGQILQANADRHTYFPFLHHEELVQHYQTADLFVFPSLLDSWAQTVLEAMACGTAAIVTENTGAKDAVQQGGGWVIPANNVDALEKCILHCMNHLEELAAKGQAAHQTAQKYTWAQYNQQLTTIITEIARRENIAL